MRGATWLARRELGARPGRAVQAAALVAVAAALGAGLELVARGREAAAGVRVDGVGPALRVVPAGVGGSELARLDLGRSLLPAGTMSSAVATLGSDLREARERLVFQRRLLGRDVPVVGVGSEPRRGVELGAAVAAALGEPSTVELGDGPRPVARVRESTGSAEDGAVFLPLPEAQALAGLAGVNELQVFLRAGSAPAAAVARLEAARLPARVVPGGRGAPADEEVQGALARGRRLAQGVLALIVVVGLAVMAHLDAAERRVEVATLRAIGALGRTVWGALVARSVTVGLSGGAVGGLAGALVAAAQDPAVAAPLLAAGSTVALVTAVSGALGALAAGPTAFAMVRRDPVPWLQEG